MLIYSNPFYAGEENGYDLDERDAICSNCHEVIDRQRKYRGIDKEFKFSRNNKDKWKHCPFCGEKLDK